MISGPSGVGKGSVVRRLLERSSEELWLSVSWTTRSPRPGEREGLDYRFVDDPAFDDMIEVGGFLEWAEVFGHRYGTPLGPIEETLAAGVDAVLEIDVVGAGQVRERMPEAVLIFLRPPSREELERRLRARGTEDQEALARRLATADAELAEASRFDHVVVNDDLDEATTRVAAIIEANRTDPTDRRNP